MFIKLGKSDVPWVRTINPVDLQWKKSRENGFHLIKSMDWLGNNFRNHRFSPTNKLWGFYKQTQKSSGSIYLWVSMGVPLVIIHFNLIFSLIKKNKQKNMRCWQVIWFPCFYRSIFIGNFIVPGESYCSEGLKTPIGSSINVRIS